LTHKVKGHRGKGKETRERVGGNKKKLGTKGKKLSVDEKKKQQDTKVSPKQYETTKTYILKNTDGRLGSLNRLMVHQSLILAPPINETV
jgi:hypothetical protein